MAAYLEQSRSGNGVHAWIFFENPCLAKKSESITLIIDESYIPLKKIYKKAVCYKSPQTV
ncbi:TOTE conflict system archaeo-eukaryotic primase domain-containing protein [Chitinophaga sancti]|uniref:TOTE conflict system archaeo-eukaryotic primase domain-containing protein n=1 Tax=Chitinophaga sancti TaxID=1004 RepID=UPI00374426A6